LAELEVSQKSARESEKKRKKLNWKWQNMAAGTVAGLLIFVLGLNVGNGRISISRNSLNPTNGNDSLPADLDYNEVEQVYDALKNTYDGKLSEDDLINGLKEGLAAATGDQYTEYLSTEEAKAFDDQLSGTFSGIGAELGKENDVLIVISPIDGFPAEKAGIRPKDVITKINDEQAYDLTVSEAVSKIRGEKGTKVKLTVIRGGSEELNFEITRDDITIPSVTTEILNGNIGYMKVSRYGEDTVELAHAGAVKFKQAGVKGVILDVRSNPGGLLEAAVDISSLWLPKGKLVLQERRGGEVVKDIKASGESVLEGVPLVVLIDEGSASASEITAGALRDNDVATLIGQKTFGKGSVQSLEELVGGGILKVTIARWYTPGGKNIDKEGIEPDQVVERTDEDYTAGRDPQRDKAVEELRK